MLREQLPYPTWSSDDLIFRVQLIPLCHQLITRQADILPIRDAAAKPSGGLLCADRCRIGTILDLQRSIQVTLIR